MKDTLNAMTRRSFLATVGALSAGLMIAPAYLLSETKRMQQRAIPSSGELLPVMGVGTSRTFDVHADETAMTQLASVLQAFFDNGGLLIDSSPMYGSAESVIGELLRTVRKREGPFLATKVWTDGKQSGIDQMQQSLRRLGGDVIDLMQIHNLRDWQTHLPTLRAWKVQGKIRYIGITTSHGRSHQELEEILKGEELDFVQFSYNLEDRAVEDRLLPLAADRGVATLINRPFQRGNLFRKVQGLQLPDWSAEFDCRSWGQFFLKFVIAHPHVTCVIPATSKIRHMTDNMGAGFGRLPDADMRRRMLSYFASL